MKLVLKEHKLSQKSFIRSGIILVGTIIVVIGLKIQEHYFKEEVTRIERNDYGEGVKKEELNLEIEGEEKQTVVVEVSPRVFTDEEIEKMFSEAISVMEKIMLDQNESFEYVTENLNFIHEVEGYPFVISWHLSEYEAMDMHGTIRRDKLKEIDPENNGVPVTVTAILRYEKKEDIYQRDLKLYLSEEKRTIIEDVLDIVTQMNSQLKEESYMPLPDNINGKKIVWEREPESKTTVLLVLGIAISILLIFLEVQEEKEEKKKKQQQMLFDYSEIVSQFIILMGAGMTAKNAWKKIVEDYRKQKIYSGRTRWAYEEMEITWMEMQNGIPELECYEHFAKRCDLTPYMKFGALLAQNLKKGTKGLWVQMEMEAHRAMNDRKNQIKKLGEEAGTKLLIPMLLMLIIVLMIVIVPAFLSIQI